VLTRVQGSLGVWKGKKTDSFRGERPRNRKGSAFRKNGGWEVSARSRRGCPNGKNLDTSRDQ